MRSNRSFFGLLLGVGAVMGLLVGLSGASDEHGSGLGTLDVVLGIMAVVVAAGAGYIGAVLDEKHGPHPHVAQHPMSPPDR